MSTTAKTRASLSVLIAAWAVPVLVLGQFAFVAGVPVAIVLAGTLRDAALRWWGAALTAAYVTPLLLWRLGADPAPSLSKDMHPAFTAVLTATGVAVAVACHVLRRASRPQTA
ncbi:hypothetical protein [Amycolatopsis samaneae]|uniref:Uncharacterized protein n=1 Tax=Amycolatopsis samaneae TaxID=664691 RepID=A0ABW5GUP8_9PSEU